MTDKRPFTGIKVLDVSRVLASPFTSGQLAFLGAEVIKIEDPNVGDAAPLGPSNNKELVSSGLSSNCLSKNAEKSKGLATTWRLFQWRSCRVCSATSACTFA